MSVVGHLNSWCPDTEQVHITVPQMSSEQVMRESLGLLFNFRHLRHLHLHFASHMSPISQSGVMVAVAELSSLRKLHITGGHLQNLAELDLQVSQGGRSGWAGGAGQLENCDRLNKLDVVVSCSCSGLSGFVLRKGGVFGWSVNMASACASAGKWKSSV